MYSCTYVRGEPPAHGSETIKWVAGRFAAARACPKPDSESKPTLSVILVTSRSPRRSPRPKLECWLVHNSRTCPCSLGEEVEVRGFNALGLDPAFHPLTTAACFFQNIVHKRVMCDVVSKHPLSYPAIRTRSIADYS